MKAYRALPENYREIFSVNLQKDKKTALLVNIMAIVIAAAMVIPMHFYVPITSFLDREVSFENHVYGISIKLGVLSVSVIAYMLLHELVHGVTMKMCGTKKVKYGFTGMYAFAGSDDYYDKRGYITIALAPVVVWGVVLAVINAIVPVEWFWVVYFIQITNISGAAGDYYVTAKFAKFPKDILVKDVGVGMTVYSKEKGTSD